MAGRRDSHFGFWLVLILCLIAALFMVFSAYPDIIYGSEAASDSVATRFDEMEQRLKELEDRVSAMANNRLPAVIEFCGERVPQERGYVRERLDKEVLFLNRKQYTLYLKRAEKYFPYIEKRIIEKRIKELKLPACLKYIAVIESALLPNALSSAKAYGPWQFIPGTADRYGLGRGLNWDERANFEKATDAALNYLSDNYKRFGKWSLAIAAYNAGENTVEAAVGYQKTNDYYDLWLPQETMQYNYRAIAAYLVMSRPELFGFSFKDTDLYKWPDVREMVYTLPKPKSVIDLAVSFKVPVNEFLWLNPWIKMPSGKQGYKERIKNFILPKGTYTFKVPKTP